MFKRILFFVVTLLMLLANASAASACLANGYQPEMPETLRR
ncbi:MAG: cyclic lactone autoinducer peptide [Eubacteriales bacterium]